MGTAGNSSGCGGKIKELQEIRNKLITLEKITEGEKRQEYKDVRTQVEELLKTSGEACPDLEIIVGLKEYVNNECAINNI